MLRNSISGLGFRGKGSRFRKGSRAGRRVPVPKKHGLEGELANFEIFPCMQQRCLPGCTEQETCASPGQKQALVRVLRLILPDCANQLKIVEGNGIQAGGFAIITVADSSSYRGTRQKPVKAGNAFVPVAARHALKHHVCGENAKCKQHDPVQGVIPTSPLGLR